MTEISTIYYPLGAERLRRQEDDRLAEALGKPAIKTSINLSEQRRRESARASAEEGLRAVSKHLGVEALKPTAKLLGISLEE